MPAATLAPVEPAVRDAAQARYALALRTVTQRTATAAVRAVLTPQLEPVMMVGAEVAGELTVAHLSTITGATSIARPQVQPLVAKALETISIEAKNAGLTKADRIRALIDAANRATSQLTYQSAAEATSAWATDTDAPIKYYVGVLSPGTVCGLCALAATRIYKRADLQPIHERCDCTIRPIMPGESLTEFKRSTLADYDATLAELKRIEEEIGKGPQGRGSRSRASNVRFHTAAHGPEAPPKT